MRIPEVETAASSLLELYQKMEDDLLRNIASKLKVDEITGDVDLNEWLMQKMLQLGQLNKENAKTIAKYAKLTPKEVEKAIKDAGYGILKYDETIYQAAYGAGKLAVMPEALHQSESIKQILRTAIPHAQNKMNLVNTTAQESSVKAFTDAVNQAYLETVTGVYDHQTAVKRAVKELGEKGIKGAHYKSAAGRETWNYIDVAVRRAVLTSASQVANEMQLARAAEWGSDLVEVSSHMGARPSHAEWQGQIYSLSGKSKKYKHFYAVTKYGAVDGLGGANCNHHFYPFFEGISERTYHPYNKEDNELAYEQSQQQRKLEREIRKEKRKIITAEAANDPQSVLAYSQRMRDKQAQMRELIADTGRERRRDREQVIGYTRGEVGRAKEASQHILSADGPKTNTALNASGTPKGYKSMITQKFDQGSDTAKEVFKKYVPDGSIASSTHSPSNSHYSRQTKQISMNFTDDLTNPRGRGVTYYHEHGHLIDDLAGRVSVNKDFELSLIQDVAKAINNEMKPGVSYADACQSLSDKMLGARKSAISDLFDGITGGDVSGTYGHSRGYWSRPNAVEIEAFAHFFEGQFTKQRYNYLKQFFPQSLDVFEEILKGAL